MIHVSPGSQKGLLLAVLPLMRFLLSEADVLARYHSSNAYA
jgi:hypothetical protein